MTYREYVEKNYPEKVNEFYCGGVKDCPHDYIFTKNRDCPFDEQYIYLDDKCNACFDREIPHDAVDARTGAPVYPAEP